MYTLGIDAFFSREEKSGVEWYTYYLLREMKKIMPPDWRFFLYSLKKDDFTAGIQNYNWQWKKLAWPPRRGWNDLRLSWEIFMHRPDILFVPAAKIPFIYPAKHTITTIHDLGFYEYPELYAPSDLVRQKKSFQTALMRASLIFTPSEATKLILKNYFDDKKIVVTPLGVDCTRYKPTDANFVQPVIEKYNLRKPYILYVGRLDAKKNIVNLIKAYAEFRKNSDLDLVLVGSAGFQYGDILKKIEELGLSDSVKIIGYVPEEDLPKIYNGARIFVFPSAYEGFGLPILQAMASGTPVVTSGIPALREVAGDVVVFVDPQNYESIAHAMDRLNTDEELRHGLVVVGLNRAKEYSWERTARKTWEGIRSLIQ